MKHYRTINLMISALIIVVAIVMAVYSWMNLPDIVATQPANFATGAPPVPKFIAVALPTMLMVVFAYLGNKERKLFFGSLIGVVTHILFLLSN